MTTTMLAPDRDQLEIFVNAVFRHASTGAVSLRSFYENRSEPFQIVPMTINVAGLVELIDIAERMAGQAANATEAIVFCPPCVTFRDGRRATKADIAEGLVLTVECDAHPSEARAKLEQILGPATLVVRSGGRWTDPQTGLQHDKLHLHWRLARPTTEKAAHSILERARQLATNLVGGDPSNFPIVHPIRWPGSWHRKSAPRLCEIEAADPDREIILELALKKLEAVAPAPEQASGNRAGTDHRTEWEDAFGQILSGESYHPTLVPLAASFAAWGAPEPVTDNVLRSLLINSQPKDAERERRRSVELAKLPQTINSAYAKFGEGDEDKPREEGPKVHWHGEEENSVHRAWLVDGLLPQTGVGLISGQWGIYKTFVGLDLAAAVMVGPAFIDLPITRQGGVLFVAVEGASDISIRIEAVHKTKYPDYTGRLPFAWIDECPRLLGPKATEKLADTANKIAEQMQRDFGVPLALIFVDTVVDAAGYAKPGDENDAAVNQIIMRRCADLSRLTGALVLGIDHFGKAVETGTRGSSAKEGRADVVLALLGDKDISGKVSNTRLCVRKNRAGPTGAEFPFTVRVINLSADESSLVIDWGAPETTIGKDSDWGRGKGVKLLRRILMTLMTDAGADIRPFADGPIVRALKVELVQAEFHKSYFGGGEGKKAKRDAKSVAFRRAIQDAMDKGVVVTRELNGEDYAWLA
jgi:hypothetical protein